MAAPHYPAPMTATKLPRLACFAFLLTVPLACTYGEVEWGGDPVVGADVQYESCNGQVWTAQTDGSGRYVFDGHTNSDEAIPDGPYLVRVDLPANPYYRLKYVNHYFSPCPDGSGKLCDQHDVDFGWHPLSGWEWTQWLEDLEFNNELEYHTFHNEICVWTAS